MKALKLKKFINASGYEVENGYFTIIEASYNSKIKLFMYTAEIYLNEAIYKEGFQPIDTFTDSFELQQAPSEDYIQYAYKHLLNLVEELGPEKIIEEVPLYKGFIDCELIKEA